MSKSIVKPLLAVVAVVALTAALIYGGLAAFTASTSNTGNSFASGTLSFTDNDSGSALFNISNLKPGDTMTRSIQVNNTGSLDANVTVSLATDGVLADALDVTVKKNNSSGDDIVSTTNAQSTKTWTYDELEGSPSQGDYSAWGAGDSKTYWIQYAFAGDGVNNDNDYQNKSATGSLTVNATSVAGDERANGSAGTGANGGAANVD